jgi:hypothetical protein
LCQKRTSAAQQKSVAIRLPRRLAERRFEGTFTVFRLITKSNFAGGTVARKCAVHYSRLSVVTAKQHMPEINGMPPLWARDQLQAVLMETTVTLGDWHEQTGVSR